MRQTAAKILAAAVLELFPNAQLLHAEATSLYFLCEFTFPFPFQKEILQHIEERMRQICKERRPIKVVEMVPHNAAAFLDHKGQNFRAELARDCSSSLISIFQMGAFADLSEGEYLKDTGGVLALKILEAKGEETVRILGIVAPDKNSLKELQKKDHQFAKKDHLQLAKAANLIHEKEGKYFWLPKAEPIKESLLNFLKEELKKENFQFVSTPISLDIARSHIELFVNSSLGLQPLPLRLAECRQVFSPQEMAQTSGMFNPSEVFQDRQHIFCPPSQLLEECISSLQFIIKISKIFDFEQRVVLCSNYALCKKSGSILEKALQTCGTRYSVEKREFGPSSIEMRTADALGREWAGPMLSIESGLVKEKRLNVALISRTVFHSLERTLALLLERGEGSLPFWLSPEQARVFALGEETHNEAQSLAEELRLKGLRVGLSLQREKLGKRLSEALSENVPYLLVVGGREKDTRSVAVRTATSEKEENMSIEALTEKLLTRANHRNGL